jgi:hypothetical protein
MPVYRGLCFGIKGLLLLRCAFQVVIRGSHAEGAALTFTGFELFESEFYEENICNVPTREIGCYYR